MKTSSLLLAAGILCLQWGACLAQGEVVDPQDEESLQPYLLEVSITPDKGDLGDLANDSDAFNARFETKLKEAYEKASMGLNQVEEASVTIIKTELIEMEESKSVKILFYVKRPPTKFVKGSEVEKIFKNLPQTEFWDSLGRDALMYPKAVKQETEDEKPQSRTLSIVAFVMGWMCLAALIVILAYLGIKYRDGIKSLAKRIEHWSNPNRNGYSNLGGEVHSTGDWRNDTDAILRDEPAAEDSRPKKKLRAPGGLLTDMEEGTEKPAHQSYGTSDAGSLPASGPSTQIRLSDLAGPEQTTPTAEPTGTPPMTPTSMQRHLIKKYQDKQVEEHKTMVAAPEEGGLTTTSSGLFPEDFADCVEEGEEEIFQVKP